MKADSTDQNVGLLGEAWRRDRRSLGQRLRQTARGLVSPRLWQMAFDSVTYELARLWLHALGERRAHGRIAAIPLAALRLASLSGQYESNRSFEARLLVDGRALAIQRNSARQTVEVSFETPRGATQFEFRELKSGGLGEVVQCCELRGSRLSSGLWIVPESVVGVMRHWQKPRSVTVLSVKARKAELRIV